MMYKIIAAMNQMIIKLGMKNGVKRSEKESQLSVKNEKYNN